MCVIFGIQYMQECVQCSHGNNIAITLQVGLWPQYRAAVSVVSQLCCSVFCFLHLILCGLTKCHNEVSFFVS